MCPLEEIIVKASRGGHGDEGSGLYPVSLHIGVSVDNVRIVAVLRDGRERDDVGAAHCFLLRFADLNLVKLRVFPVDEINEGVHGLLPPALDAEDVELRADGREGSQGRLAHDAGADDGDLLGILPCEVFRTYTRDTAGAVGGQKVR